MKHHEIEKILARVTSTRIKPADERVKTIVDALLKDIFFRIDEFDIQPAEFWTALDYLSDLGRGNEYALLAAGLGLEHYFDVRADARDAAAGVETGATPRTIEGPLYVAGAPVCQNEARLDEDGEEGEPLFVSGRVMDTAGHPIPGARVEVWHGDQRGNYSFFDKTQSIFHLRRTIIADAQGRYRFRSIMPSGYGCPPSGPTQRLLDLLGRHGQRPAHIHFMVSAPGYRHLTTQINIQGDPYLHDDFAFATRDDLVPDVVRHSDPAALRERGIDRPYATIAFNFVLPHAIPGTTAEVGERPRASVA